MSKPIMGFMDFFSYKNWTKNKLIPLRRTVWIRDIHTINHYYYDIHHDVHNDIEMDLRRTF